MTWESFKDDCDSALIDAIIDWKNADRTMPYRKTQKYFDEHIFSINL